MMLYITADFVVIPFGCDFTAGRGVLGKLVLYVTADFVVILLGGVFTAER